MWTRQELKEKGKAAFKANYWKCVISALILTALTGIETYITTGSGQESSAAVPGQLSGMPAEAVAVFAGISVLAIVICILVKVFIFNPLEVGCHRFFIENCTDSSTGLGAIKKGFIHYRKVFITLFLRDLFLALWTLLFIIPGVIKAYSYRMVPYIEADEPELGSLEIITKSREMMKGHKWKAFVLDLSFIGWHLLALVTFGLSEVFWTSPYIESTNAELYLSLKQSQ